MKKMDVSTKSRVTFWIMISTYVVVLFLILQNGSFFLKQLSQLMGIVAPVFVGFGIAFVLNGPLKAIEKYLLRGMDNNKWGKKFKRPTSMLLTYLLFFCLLGLFISIIIPQIVTSATTLASAIPGYIVSVQGAINSLVTQYNIDGEYVINLMGSWQQILSAGGKLLGDMLPSMLSFTMSVTSGLSNVFIGFIISIYLLAGKERFAALAKRMLTAYLPDLQRDRVLRVGHIANTTFSGFISGQLLDAMIVGVLCMIGMNLLPLAQEVQPYIVLISTIIAITNIVPIFGPYIGGVPCTFILLMVDFTSALWFVLLIVAIQAVDGNIICPKIVGDSIGLSGFWVIFAITLGGGLFGLPGMVLGIPTFAVLYKVIKIVTDKRIAQKQTIVAQQDNEPHTLAEEET